MKENKERNKELYEDKKAGMSLVDLINKYKISPSAIYSIYNREVTRRKFNGVK